MSNSQDTLSPASRAMLVGALVGGAASAASQWQRRQSGEIDTDHMVKQATQDALKTGIASGGATYLAQQMAGRPALSMLTILSVGAAGLYMLQQHKDGQHNE
ncbi:hypothetical protein FLM48_04655 [Shewanella sp. Scap07]|uniref:hypothetical protein n=1 Tax=Shewanella sp. Scap07 TaxID=2589987 RepID=UPI0015B86103|nr:hypothetical protein [Shewanella sp. Scap07]QLE84441.1 hypothetical protein FLM48_04655 [Shewanella sp. Scap07]